MTDDLISRADAIALWDKYHPYIATKAMEFDGQLRAIPSAQPKIVRCKECRHYNTMTNGCKRNPSVEPWGDNDFCSYGERSE